MIKTDTRRRVLSPSEETFLTFLCNFVENSNCHFCMAKFRIATMPDMKGDGDTLTYPRMVHAGVTTTEQMAVDLQARTTFTTSDIKGLLDALSYYIAEQTAEGRSMRIDGIGIFKATLALVDGKEREVEGGTKRNAQSVYVRSVKFRPDKQLIARTQERMRLERVSVPKRKLLLATRKERLSAAIAYIEKEGFLRIADYVTLTGLSRTMATMELRLLYAEKLLDIKGRGVHKVYVRRM